MIDLSGLRGYVLEELLAALLHASGFDLLVAETQDPVALCKQGNGLRVRGRGADHQVDVLGQLRLRLPFSYPIRLFVEAKHRGKPTGLADVRNALGVISDVNEHYSTALAASATPAYVRYHYRYALFSASGFTNDAQQFAIAQQISLVDLRGPGFRWITDAATRIAEALFEIAQSAGLETFPVGQMREALRRALGTWPLEVAEDVQHYSRAATKARTTVDTEESAERLPPDRLAGVAAQAADIDGRLYFGFTDRPFLLVLQPDEPAEAAAVLVPGARQVLTDLRFAGSSTDTGDWTLTTVTNEGSLTFRLALPPLLEELVFDQAAPGESIDELPGVRAVVVALGDQDSELVFEPIRDEERPSDESNESRRDYRRRVRLDPDLAVPGAEPDKQTPTWTSEAAHELVARLRAEHWPHAEIIEFAASRGGVIGRDDVYEIAQYPADRMLRGFTRPTARIAKEIIRDGLLPRGAEMPLTTHYASGVVATHWTVPTEFTWLLA